MTDVADFIKHHGVKGMKWGQRRAVKKLAKADKKWEKKQLSFNTVVKVYNGAAAKANADLPKINKKYEGKNLISDNKARERYDQELVSNFNKHVQTVASAQGLNPSGSKRLQADINPLTGDFLLRTVEVTHADNDEVVLKVERDAKGFVTRMWLPVTNVMQSDVDSSVAKNFIQHYGRKGMKWGVRKDRGGKGSAPKAKDLSDADLKAAVNRMNLEKQYNTLSGQKSTNVGKIFVNGAKKIALNVLQQQAQAAINKKIGEAITAKLVK